MTPAEKAELERQAQANPGGYSEIGPEVDDDDDRDSDEDFMEAAGAGSYMSVNPSRAPSEHSGYFDVHPDAQ